MSECWSEKPEDRPAFRWIRGAMKRLIKDHKVYTRESTETKGRQEIDGRSLVVFYEKGE